MIHLFSVRNRQRKNQSINWKDRWSIKQLLLPNTLLALQRLNKCSQNMWTFIENRWSQLNAQQTGREQRLAEKKKQPDSLVSSINRMAKHFTCAGMRKLLSYLDWLGILVFDLILCCEHFFFSSFPVLRTFPECSEVFHKNSFDAVRSIDENIGMSRHESVIMNEYICDIASAVSLLIYRQRHVKACSIDCDSDL